MICIVCGVGILAASVVLGSLLHKRRRKKSLPDQVVLLDNVLLIHTDERIIKGP